MISSKFVLKTISEIRQFRRILNSLSVDLVTGEPESVANNIRAIDSLSGAARGFLGGFYYDLTQSSYCRLDSEIISAEALFIASVADDFIDEGDLVLEQKVEVVNNLLKTITKGQISDIEYPEVRALSVIGKDLYNRISKSPNPDKFFDEYSSLAKVVIEQLRGSCSLELAEQIGGGTMAISAVLPYCYNPQLSERYLESAKKLGGYFQMLDNIWDYKHDKRRGISTFITTADCSKRAKSEVKRYAFKLYHDCLKPLTHEEQQRCRSLNMFFHMKWVTDRITGK